MDEKSESSTVRKINWMPNFKERVDCRGRRWELVEEDEVLGKTLWSGKKDISFNFLENGFFVCGHVCGEVEGLKQISYQGINIRMGS
jgi:hypothetical protein